MGVWSKLFGIKFKSVFSETELIGLDKNPLRLLDSKNKNIHNAYIIKRENNIRKSAHKISNRTADKDVM